jgi:hypothetical protein
MKFGLGFVSNSSSSSYICCICGNLECAPDLRREDCDMAWCKGCESDICRKHIAEEEDDGVSKEESEEEGDGEIKAIECPLCTFQDFSKLDIVHALEVFAAMTTKDVKEKLKREHPDRAHFEDWLSNEIGKLKAHKKRTTSSPSQETVRDGGVKDDDDDDIQQQEPPAKVPRLQEK